LTTRLVMLARHPEARLRLGNSGRLRAKSFRPDDVVGALESTYREVLARRDREQF
jgi:hypothetical protein